MDLPPPSAKRNAQRLNVQGCVLCTRPSMLADTFNLAEPRESVDNSIHRRQAYIAVAVSNLASVCGSHVRCDARTNVHVWPPQPLLILVVS